MTIKKTLGAGIAALAFLTQPLMAQTMGPGGETATPSSEVTVDAAMLTGKGYTAALLWHDQSDFVNAVTAGATDEFTRLGIEVTITTSAGFDAAKQRSDIETALARNPNIILALPLDPVTSALHLNQLWKKAFRWCSCQTCLLVSPTQAIMQPSSPMTCSRWANRLRTL